MTDLMLEGSNPPGQMTDFGSLQMIQTHFVLLLIGRRKEKHREQIRSLNSHRKYKNRHVDSEVNCLTKMEDGWLEKPQKASTNSKIENSKTKTLCVPKHHACLSMRTCDSKCFFCLEIASRCHYKPPTSQLRSPNHIRERVCTSLANLSTSKMSEFRHFHLEG